MKTFSSSKAKSDVVVLDVWGSIDARFGGVGPAASSLATAVSSLSGMKTKQIAICNPFECDPADGIDPDVVKIDAPRLRGWSDYRISKALKSAVLGSDICHVHGLWMPHCLAVRELAGQMRKPVVSSVHGMLEYWEMRNKQTKKNLYSWLFERPSLSQSSCLRALTNREVQDYKRYGIRKPIALIPNGIKTLRRVETADLFRRFPELSGKQIVLFLGRVHHKKGVLNLLRSWKKVTLTHRDAHLVVAGAEYGDTGNQMRKLIDELDLQKSITVMGVISGQSKMAALSAAKYFCLPSYSEGLSVAVLESLSIGLPVVVTPDCNIDVVASKGAGFVTSNEIAPLTRTLSCALGVTANEWRKMSMAAQDLAVEEFGWSEIARRMNSVYEWLLGGDKPSCVIA